MHCLPRFLISVGCTYAALILKVVLVTVFASQVYSERLHRDFISYSKIASETISEGLEIKNFLGEHAPTLP